MRPFLKWVGGKHKIVNKLNAVLPVGKRLIEPFVGSGAVFLNTDYKEYILADLNPDLINVFQFLKGEKSKFIDYCATLFTHEHNNELVFLQKREKFNATTNKRLKAALFLYLNRHGYNGLIRYNSSGGFNVPFGRYEKPYFPRKEMLFFAEKAQNIQLQTADFKTTMAQAKAGDIVYCDPPYVPLSATARFTEYGKNTFGAAEQNSLLVMTKKIVSKGATVVISNHDTALINELYKEATIHRFAVQRFISCKASSRNKAQEVLAVFSK